MISKFVLIMLWSVTSAVEYKGIGNYKMPILGLGTFAIGSKKDITFTINEALNLGYRHIDTATLYDNEEVIGTVLKDWISSGKVRREDLFITTKLAPFDFTPDHVKNAIVTSLRKLQLEYVDLWLIHQPIAMKIDFNAAGTADVELLPTDHVAVWKKMEEQVDAGRVRNIGVSNFNVSQIERIINNARIQPSNLQVEIHPYFQQHPLREFASRNNITVTAFSPLGNPGLVKIFEMDKSKVGMLPDILGDKIIRRIGEKHRKSAAQIVLKFLTQSDIVVIPKSSNPKRLKENIDVFDFTLDEDDMKAMEGLDEGKTGRIFSLKDASAGLVSHPEFPFCDE